MARLSTQSIEREEAALLGAVGLVQRSREFSRRRYVVVIVALVITTFGLSIAALALTVPGSNTATWWPAVGASVVLYLLYRGPVWQILVVIAVIAATSSLLVGRPPVYALWGMVITVSELAAFVAVLGPQGRNALLGTVRGMLRFFTAVIASSVTAGVTGALAFVLLVDANPITTFSALVPSHFSALLLIVPLALVPLPRHREGTQLELVVQSAAIVLTLAALTQAQTLPIGALLFPVFAWAAVRFRPIVVTAQLAAFGFVAAAFVALNQDPFAASASDVSSALVVQIYLLSMALTTLSITAVRSERAELRAENLRRAGMLRGGFVGSQVGSVFLRRQPDSSSSIIEINEVAANLVDHRWVDPLIEAWVTSDADDLSTEVLLNNGHTVQVYGRRVPTADGESVLGLQIVDITDFVAAQDAMARAMSQQRRVAEELRALSQQKDDFVSAVSHELRTPITSIVGFAEELHEGAHDDQRQATEIILRNSLRLAEMVEELLELGRVTAPHPLRENRSVDLATIVAETVQDQSASATAKRVTVTVGLSAAPTIVQGTTNALGRIVTNLLSNAIKFSPDDGTVSLTTALRSDTVVLSVDDSGPGISDSDKPRVFERFFRSLDEEKRRTPGTGLGLSIVKALVESLDGRVDIGHSPLGGARVTVSLPNTREAHPGSLN